MSGVTVTSDLTLTEKKGRDSMHTPESGKLLPVKPYESPFVKCWDCQRECDKPVCACGQLVNREEYEAEMDRLTEMEKRDA